jgi:hypothetical protein
MLKRGGEIRVEKIAVNWAKMENSSFYFRNGSQIAVYVKFISFSNKIENMYK